MEMNLPTPQIDNKPNAAGRNDDFSWLETLDSSNTQKYLKAEQQYTQSYFKKQNSNCQKLFSELKARIKLADESAPWKYGNYYYFIKTHADSEYSILCRKQYLNSKSYEVLLDENILAQDKDFMDIGCHEILYDGSLLAFTADYHGDEKYQLYVKNLYTQNTEQLPIKDIAPEIIFSEDGKYIYYLTLDEQHRPFRCYKYNCKTQQSTLCYQEDDEKYTLNISKSKSRRFIYLTISSNDTTESYYLDCENSQEKFVLFKSRQEHVEYYLEHHAERFYILTNEAAIRFKILCCPIEPYNPENIILFKPEHQTLTYESIEAFSDYLVITERSIAATQLRVVNYQQTIDYLIEFDEPVYSVEPIDNYEMNNILRFSYESLHIPEHIYDFDLNNQIKSLIKKQEVLGDFDSNNFRCERIFATAQDGTQIPISLVYHKNKRKESGPLYLYGYGAYGAPMDIWFSTNRLSMLNRGVIFAIAHIRGGGDCGKPWHDAGKLLNKKNTFTDFIACAEYLIDKRYTSSQQLVISGGSAGGLLIGSVLNMKPNLCHLAFADVPFVDVLNTMLNPELPLTIGEYDEWGNPEQSEYFDYIASYSPYENVQTNPYPNIYVSIGLTDYRVNYWEACKWVAKLRYKSTSNNLILLNIQESAGHAGLSKRFDALLEIAKEYIYLFERLNIEI